jgi:hypothetical protein
MAKSKRKKEPTREAICTWHVRNPSDWFLELWGGMGGILTTAPKEMETTCWLSKRGGNHRCHIVPDALGGSNHPSNFVILCPPVHARCPNVSDPKIFTDWLLAEHRQSVRKAVRRAKEACNLVFPGRTQDDELLNRLWAGLNTFGSNAFEVVYETLGIESIKPYGHPDNNPCIEAMLVLKKYMDRFDLWDLGTLDGKLEKLKTDWKNLLRQRQLVSMRLERDRERLRQPPTDTAKQLPFVFEVTFSVRNKTKKRAED